MADTLDVEQVTKRERGLDRAFAILEYLKLKREPANPNEIAAQLGAPRSSVYELVGLLLRQGVLETVDEEGRVFLGRKLYFLGHAYEERYDFTRECERVLDALASETHETAQFCMLDGDKYVVVRMRESARPFRISSDIGQPVPLPWTASSRLLLGDLSDAEIRALVPPEDFTLPDRTHLAPDAFIAQIRAATQDGFFTMDSTVDSFTHCFAVPVAGMGRACIATLCIVASRTDAARNRERYIAALKAAAAMLSGRAPLSAAGSAIGALRL